MPDGTEFLCEGLSLEPSALREFVLRFMSSQEASWNAMHWSEETLGAAFEERFGNKVKVRREARSDGRTVFVIRPSLSFA